MLLFKLRESSSVGRASASQAEGREFEPRFSLIVNQPLRYYPRWLFCCGAYVGAPTDATL